MITALSFINDFFFWIEIDLDAIPNIVLQC
jgi:hypothetical protein